MRRITTLFLLVVVSAMGCSSLPPQQDPANWHEVELGEGMVGRWFVDEQAFILQFRFPLEMSKVTALRSVDLPGNGFDIYTQEGIDLGSLHSGAYQMKLARHFQLDYQLFFLLQWKRRSQAWPEQRFFVFKNNQLYYSED